MADVPRTRTEHPEATLATHVPGICIWRFPRQQIKGKRFRPHILTHEPSGFSLLMGGRGKSTRSFKTQAEALDVVSKLGEIKWRGKPFDWSQSVEVIRENDRARTALIFAAGFMVFGVTDKTLGVGRAAWLQPSRKGGIERMADDPMTREDGADGTGPHDRGHEGAGGGGERGASQAGQGVDPLRQGDERGSQQASVAPDEPKVELLSWDWREQPTGDRLDRAVRAVSDGAVGFTEVDTHSDQYAFIVSSPPLDKAEAQARYDNWKWED